jgi:hypothetical protein
MNQESAASVIHPSTVRFDHHHAFTSCI